MKNVNSISFKTLDDKSLSVLYANLAHEINARAEAKVIKRKQWVRKMFDCYLRHPHAGIKQIGEITIVSVYDNYYGGPFIGTSKPINNDEYNKETGVAVAFAKAIGEPIPDYI